MHKQTPIYPLHKSTTGEDGWQISAPVQLRGVRLSDHSARARILLQGTGALALLRRHWDLPDLPHPIGATVPQGYAFCLRRDHYFLSLSPGTAPATISVLQEATLKKDGLITVTDLSHGRAELWLQGPSAAFLLSHLCGLDFHRAAFPDLAARESSVGRTHQLILRHDREGEPTYALVGPRSLGAYLWDTITEIGQRDLEHDRLGAGPPAPLLIKNED